MKIYTATCFSHVLWLLSQGEKFANAINSFKIVSPPDFASEGVKGYIETEIEVDVKDLKLFASIWYGWYDLPVKVRYNLYTLIKDIK